MIEAAAEAGIARVQVVDADGETIIAVRRSGLTPEQKAKLALYDNRTAELAEWDTEVLGELAEVVDLSGLWEDDELTELGLGEWLDVPEDPGPQVDRATELQEKWKVERGQVWEIPSKAVAGKCHRLMCGDSTSEEDVGTTLASAIPALMVTDPPYGVQYKPQWRNDAGLSKTSRNTEVTNDDRASWAAAFRLFPGDVAYVWHAAFYASVVLRALEICRFQLRSQIVWVKQRFAISRGHYHWRHELCWYAVKLGRGAHWSGSRRQQTVWAEIVDLWTPEQPWFAGRIAEDTLTVFDADMTTVWNISANSGSGDATHPTVKPLNCMLIPIRNHKGDVYDPFVGSGTTMVAAEQTGRVCYGMEIEPKYCSATLERLAGMELEPRLAE